MTAHYPAGVTLGTEEGIPLPRTVALIEQLTSEHGAEYTLALTRTVEDTDQGDQVSYMAGLNEAIDVLLGPGGDRPACKALAVSHVGVFLTEISADIRSASHYGAISRAPLLEGDRSGEVDHDRC